jgi:hypothetical protein
MKIRIKRPRVTIGPVKISAPDPVRIIRDVHVAAAGVVADGGRAVLKGTGRGLNDIFREGSTAATNIRREGGRLGTNVWRETVRTGENLGDVGTALYRYGVGWVEGTGKKLSNAERRIREGKIFDALFHLAYDPLVLQEKLADQALNDSKYLNTIAATAATAYAGPNGAAAYSAWRTYRATGGDVDRALRAGLIAGLTSAGMGEIGKIEGDYAAMKKTILAGALGGAAVAASGGDDEAILQGFLRAGGMVLVQESYRDWTTQEIDARAAIGEAYCTAADPASCTLIEKAIKYDEKGKPYLDGSMLDSSRNFVGGGSLGEIRDPSMLHDSSALMNAIGKVPGMNAMAFLHDHWAVSWEVGGHDPLSVVTIPPAIVLTYLGTGAPLYTKLVETSSAAPRTGSPPAETPPAPVRPAVESVGRVLDVEVAPVEVVQPEIEPKEEFIRARRPTPELAAALRRQPDRREKRPQPRPGVTPQYMVARILRGDAEETRARIAADARYQLLDLLVRPGPGWIWARPEVATDFSIRQHPGVIFGEGGKIAPAPGWRWEDEAADTLALVPYSAVRGDDGLWSPSPGWIWAWKEDIDLAVVREGLAISDAGEIFPLRGWDWQDPTDMENVTLAAEGLVRTESGSWQPLPDWHWEEPEDPHNLAVRQFRLELNREVLVPERGIGFADPRGPLEKDIILERGKIR